VLRAAAGRSHWTISLPLVETQTHKNPSAHHPWGCLIKRPPTLDSGPWSLGVSVASSYVLLMQTHVPIQLLDDEAIGGPILGAEHHHVKTFPCGRVCEHEGCSTQLSVYNYGSLCATHDKRGVPLYVHAHPAATRGATRSSHRRAV
jgi:hypothetical protein